MSGFENSHVLSEERRWNQFSSFEPGLRYHYTLSA